MIIDRTSRVLPPRFEDKVLRSCMGDYLGKASQDDVMATFFWHIEGRIARDIFWSLKRHRERVTRELSEACTRAAADLEQSALEHPLCAAARAAAADLVDRLEDEKTEASQAVQECFEVWEEMTRKSGRDHTSRYLRDTEPRVPSPLESVAPLWHQYLAAEKRVDKLIAADRQELHSLAIQLGRAVDFVRSERSVDLESIDRLHHRDFELLAAKLIARDGYDLKRDGGGAGDLGADVIAEGPDGRTVVIQCKHVRDPRSTVGSPVLQRLNGTARQIHGADVVVAATNGSFSLPARRFAASQKIHLVDRRMLQRWATWGRTIEEILELPPAA